MVMNRSQIGGELWKPGAQAPSIIGGRVFTPAACYPSSSNPKKKYTVCEVSDGTTSCDCPGWTKRNPPGGRTCKHTQDYEQFLRPLWNNLGYGQAAVDGAVVIPEPAVQAPEKAKGGTLSDLFAKLEKEGFGGKQ
jgi:hypothetical protein